MPFISQGKTNIKYLAIVVVFAILAVLGVYLYWQGLDGKVEPIQNIEREDINAGQISAVDARNATYIIGGKEFTLVDGRSEEETVPGSASKIVTQYFGNDVKADFNGDGINDVAFLLTQNSGGSGNFYYVAAVLGAKNGYNGTNAIFIGDRIAPQTTDFQNGEIVINYAERKTGEPMTDDPSVGVSKYFKVSDGNLLEIQ